LGAGGNSLRVKSGLLYKRKPAELWLVQNLEIHAQIRGTYSTSPPPPPPKKKEKKRGGKPKNHPPKRGNFSTSPPPPLGKKGGITVGAKPRNSNSNLFKRLGISPLPRKYEYIFSLIKPIGNNHHEIFRTNSAVHRINTRTEHYRHKLSDFMFSK